MKLDDSTFKGRNLKVVLCLTVIAAVFHERPTTTLRCCRSAKMFLPRGAVAGEAVDSRYLLEAGVVDAAEAEVEASTRTMGAAEAESEPRAGVPEATAEEGAAPGGDTTTGIISGAVTSDT